MIQSRLEGSPESERKSKEALVLDNALEDLTKVYWGGMVFDGFAVTTKYVASKDIDKESQVFSEHEDVITFL